MKIRLNKVTRDLNVGISTVVEFLQKKGYDIEANPNTQISDEQYAALVKEFSKDKDLKIESEKIIHQRQIKERNKASVSIDDMDDKKEDNIVETVIPDEALPKFKPVGKIDLDSLNGKRSKHTANKASEKKNEQEKSSESKEDSVAQVERPVKVEHEVEKEAVKDVKVPAQEKKVEKTPFVVATDNKNVEEKTADKQKNEKSEVKSEEVKKEHPSEEKSDESKTISMKEDNKEVQSVEQTKEDDIFKIRPTEFKSKINVVGQIDLAALNQSTRPKKKSKEERRKEREEKDKQRQEQRKQMKDAIIKEIRKSDDTKSNASDDEA